MYINVLILLFITHIIIFHHLILLYINVFIKFYVLIYIILNENHRFIKPSRKNLNLYNPACNVAISLKKT
jgi:type IV secretory pathway VirB3-like protein